jgi:hypothetical protein
LGKIVLTKGEAAGSGGGSDETGNIRIGELGFINACFVQSIFGVPVTGDPVCVNSDGQLGVCEAGRHPVSMKELLKEIALQKNQIQTLTAALKQQAEQIQKVSAQLEMIRRTPASCGESIKP